MRPTTPPTSVGRTMHPFSSEHRVCTSHQQNACGVMEQRRCVNQLSFCFLLWCTSGIQIVQANIFFISNNAQCSCMCMCILSVYYSRYPYIIHVSEIEIEISFLIQITHCHLFLVKVVLFGSNNFCQLCEMVVSWVTTT